ncbi:MAG: proteasome ATPase [Corynebacterium variabile]|uniref:proteasome ATPase n=1 Tax=Corynebacterium variabile TaxID=1727 RepID=UPI002649BF4E|nr:proteasome ATPase [Corynebacterium variabile]MDN6476900.1 proteasome ATPase [Corynebacterium variabile]MDN6619448.1 proteasome ATPase [Corynebacterium variabile]MDN6845042.1 proteasome ATPase [Corynebacterium variabile]
MTNGPAHDTTADARHGSHTGGTGGPTSPVDSGPESYRQLQLANRTLGTRNAKLTELLKASRDKLDELNGRLDALAEPPSTYGTLLETGPDAFTAEVHTAGRRMRLMVSPRVDRIDLTPGALVRLGEGSQVVEVCGTTDAGDLASVVEVVDASRIVVADKLGEESLMKCAGALTSEIEAKQVGPGDSVVVDRRAGYAFEVITRAEVENLVLEEVPDVDYSDIGGLTSQIEQLHDAVELPFLHPELYRDYGLLPPKGVLLYGPPGCGKTLIAKAVASSLARRMDAAGDGPTDGNSRSYFLNIKGPELLNKFVGETERQIRLIFERARKIASAGAPVIIFFDEMEAIFRTRGTGVSSDVESTVVPQLLAEIDGVEGLRNVIVIGASNREELIDPAILRPGRLDVKIRVQRPDREASLDILGKYLTDDLPLDPAATAAELRERVVNGLFSHARPFLTLHFSDGSARDLFYGDFASGAMLANIVDRAKKFAIKDALRGNGSGISAEHIDLAVAQECHDNDDLPDTTNPAEWARISGHSSRRVVDITVHQQEATA